MNPRLVIAVVEDDDAVRDSLASLIRSLDMTPRSYASARDFLNEEGWGGTDCLLADIRMPVMDGIAMYQTLLARGIRLPVIFMSASTSERTLADVLDLGASGFIKKSRLGASLLPCVRKALGLGT